MFGNGPENRDNSKGLTELDSLVLLHTTLAQWQSLRLKPELRQFDSDEWYQFSNAMSSNGRTRDFESRYLGSNPSAASNFKCPFV